MAGRGEPQLGVVRSGDLAFDEYRHCVDRVTKNGFALFPC
jgi:hypothetical protein